MSTLPCRACASGALHGGTPKGKVESWFDLPTYVAEPPAGQEPKGIVVIIPDAFGWELPNNRILADSMAENGGFTVLLPEFMDGHSLPHDLLWNMHDALNAKNSIFTRVPNGLRTAASFLPFVFFNRESIVKPRIIEFFKQLRSKYALPVGVAGYCWGGRYTVILCWGDEQRKDAQSNSRPLIDCGYTAHPSMLSIPGDIDKVRLPLSVAHATEDMAVKPHLAEKIKESLKGEGREDCEFVEYEGAEHGFAVRGDPDDEKVKRQGKEAEEQATKWFGKCFEKAKEKYGS